MLGERKPIFILFLWRSSALSCVSIRYWPDKEDADEGNLVVISRSTHQNHRVPELQAPTLSMSSEPS